MLWYRPLQAAKALGVAPITLKRICQRRNYRWPYRSVKAAEKRLERQRAAAIAAAISSVGSAVYVNPSAIPTHSSSQPLQFAPPAPVTAHRSHLGMLTLQFPRVSASMSMQMAPSRPRAVSSVCLTDSPPSTAMTTPVNRTMSPQSDKRTSSPSELSLRSSPSRSPTAMRLPPLRVALDPHYIAMRQHVQLASAELRLRYP